MAWWSCRAGLICSRSGRSLLQSPLTTPRDAIPELLGRDDGRLASFVEAIEGLDTAHVRLVRDDAVRDEKERQAQEGAPRRSPRRRPRRSAEAFRALYQTFVDVEPAWKTSEFPFFRLGADPTLLLAMAPIGPDGRVFGTDRVLACAGRQRRRARLARRTGTISTTSDAITLPEFPTSDHAVIVAFTPGDAEFASLSRHGWRRGSRTRRLADRVYMTRACAALSTL